MLRGVLRGGQQQPLEPFRLRAVLLGDRNTGKTAFAVRACNDQFSRQKAAVTADCSRARMHCLDRLVLPEGRQLILDISDPDGMWLRGADGMDEYSKVVAQADIILFFTSDRDCDEHLRIEKYVTYAKKHAPKHCLYGFVLNLRLRQAIEFQIGQLEQIVFREQAFGYVVSVEQNENVLESIFDMSCVSYYASRLLARQFLMPPPVAVANAVEKPKKYEAKTTTAASLTDTSGVVFIISGDDKQQQQQQQTDRLWRRWWRRAIWC